MGFAEGNMSLMVPEHSNLCLLCLDQSEVRILLRRSIRLVE